MPTELADGNKLEFDEEVYDIGPGKCTGSCGGQASALDHVEAPPSLCKVIRACSFCLLTAA